VQHQIFEVDQFAFQPHRGAGVDKIANPLQRLPKPAKVPSIPLSAIYQMKLLVPAQQGPDAASPPPDKTESYNILLGIGLEVGGTPQISRCR
jgi:hypothetical protein